MSNICSSEPTKQQKEEFMRVFSCLNGAAVDPNGSLAKVWNWLMSEVNTDEKGRGEMSRATYWETQTEGIRAELNKVLMEKANLFISFNYLQGDISNLIEQVNHLKSEVKNQEMIIKDLRALLLDRDKPIDRKEIAKRVTRGIIDHHEHRRIGGTFVGEVK